jgi:type IV pilus assembly protein PilY1
LGAGGKGYFVLDVTKPGLKSGATDGPASNFTNNDANAAAIVRMDMTDGSDADIGYIFGDPVTADLNPYLATQIARMNDGRWALIFGNGFNSTNERPVLVIQYLDGNTPSRVTIVAATGTTGNAVANGLSTPRPVDLNGDGTPDVVYAGDLKGNLWKFDVSSADTSKWGVAFSSAGCGSTASPCTPFYTATYNSNAQPITAAPNVRAVPSLGGIMVAFGTGRNLTEADRTDSSQQTFYALLDNTKYKIDAASGKVSVDDKAPTPTPVGSGRSNLTQRTFNSASISGTGSSAGDTFWNMTTGQTTFSYSGDSAKKGWYFDFPKPGERLLQTPEFLSGSNVLQIKSTIPASGGSVDSATESCSPNPTAAQSFLTLMGIEQGLKPVVQLLDANGDGIFSTAANNDNSVNRTTTSPEEIVLNAPGKKVRIGSDNKNRTVKDLPKPASTINWRQLQ